MSDTSSISFTTHNNEPYASVADIVAWMHQFTWAKLDHNGVRTWLANELTLAALAYSSEAG